LYNIILKNHRSSHTGRSTCYGVLIIKQLTLEETLKGFIK